MLIEFTITTEADAKVIDGENKRNTYMLIKLPRLTQKGKEPSIKNYKGSQFYF